MKLKTLGDNYRADIDGLRALAVLSVVLFHLDFSFFQGGFVGVDIFFVISGFLITKIIHREVLLTQSFNFKKFYIRRARRILPALMLTFFVSIVFSVLLFSPPHLEIFGKSLIAAIVSASNILFWMEAGYFDTDSIVKPLLHTWSLGIEEQYYLIWPLALSFSLLKLPKYALPLVLFFLISCSLYGNLLFLDGFAYFDWLGDYFLNGPSNIFYLLPFRVFEFSIGGLLVIIEKYEVKNNKILELLFLFGLLLIIDSICFFSKDTVFPSYNALVPCFGAAFIVYAGKAKYLTKLLTNPVMVRIGLVSYSFYLIHWPIIVFWGYWTFDSISLVARISIFFVSMILAFFIFQYVEQPFRCYGAEKISAEYKISNKKFALLTISISILFVLIGSHMWFNNGWRWRVADHNFPPELWEQIKYSHKFHESNYGGHGYPYTGSLSESSVFDVVLMGDSHARHYAAGLDYYFSKERGYSIYSASGTSCLHLPSFTRIGSQVDWNERCARQLAEGMEVLESNENAMLILSHSWVSQLQKAGILNADNTVQTKLSIDDVIEGIHKLKEDLGEHPLVVIGDVPQTGVSRGVLHQLLRPNYILPYNHTKQINPLVRKRNADDPLELFNLRLKNDAMRTKAYYFLDPFDALCNEKECANTDGNGKLIYSDKAHLSVSGSKYIIEYFSKQLDEILDHSKQSVRVK